MRRELLVKVLHFLIGALDTEPRNRISQELPAVDRCGQIRFSRRRISLFKARRGRALC